MNDDRDRMLRRIRQELVTATAAHAHRDGPARPAQLDHASVAFGLTMARRLVDEALGIHEDPRPDALHEGRAALYEQLASIQHDIWSHWMAYVFDHCATENEDGSVTIPAELAKRWRRQVATGYSELSERERESDRDQVDKFWPLLHLGAPPRGEKAAR